MLVNKYKPWLAGALLVCAAGGAGQACAASSTAAGTAVGSNNAPLIDASKISAAQTTILTGTVPLRVAHSTDTGRMGQTEVIPSMTLLLKRTPLQQKALSSYVASLSSPGSANYHKWLTAKQVGAQFGPNDQDISTVENWLKSQGLAVKSVSADKMMIHISGSVGAVERAFGRTMHHYVENGKTHFANATEQKLPAALTPVVAGVASLSDFFPTSQAVNVGAVKRNAKGQWVSANASSSNGPSSNFNSVYNGHTYFDVAPADFNTIYNVNPEWNQGVRGAGQTVVVLEDSDVKSQDVATFRQTFLPSNAQGMFSQVNPVSPVGAPSCTDPGASGDEVEAALDAEWAGAAAPDANVVLASCADTGSDFGAFLAAENLLNSPTPPPIISLSYGECEMVAAAVGDADEVQYLWNVAASEGVTVFVSSGDSGSGGCDQDSGSGAHFGLQVNGLGSTPFNVAVGGTDFNDMGKTSSYWEAGNGDLGASALGYVPEMTWNDSCASPVLDAALGYSNPLTACNQTWQFSSVVGGSGGPSYLWEQPAWQTGVAGMAQTVTRSLPDISLFAANGLYGHALLYCMSDTTVEATAQPCNYLNPTDVIFNSAGGTSFAAPAMAGVQALINQAAGTTHGNIGPMLYQLARKEYGINGSPLNTCGSNGSGANCVFHDVTVGNNDEPCPINSDDCYAIPNESVTLNNGTVMGVLSSGGSQSLVPAWATGAGYDYATGLGSINVANLVNAITAQDTRSQTIPRTWDLMGVNESGNDSPGPQNPTTPWTPLQAGDGHSTILMLPPASCLANFQDCSSNETDAQYPVMAWMSGGTVVQVASPVPAFNPVQFAYGQPFQAGDEIKAVATDLFSGELQGQPVQIADNPITNTLTLDVYSWGNYEFTFPYPAGWTLVGTGVVDSTNQSEAIFYNSTTHQLGFWSFSCSGTQHIGQLWDISCNRTIGNVINNIAAGYTPHLADLNGDGYLDIVWTGVDNDLYYWINDGTGNFTKSYGGTFPAGWVLEGAGEIAGSGMTDLIWYNGSTSQFGWWIMNGTSVVRRSSETVTAGYTIASIEDFDGDGLADILWTNAQGTAYIWQGTGNGFISERVADGLGNPYTIPAGYVVQKNSLQGVVSVQQNGGGGSSGGGSSGGGSGGGNPPTLP